jgi:hypothetical protein
VAYGVNKKVEQLSVYTPMHKIEPGEASLLLSIFRGFPHHDDQLMKKIHIDQISILYDTIKVVKGNSTKIIHNPWLPYLLLMRNYMMIDPKNL